MDFCLDAGHGGVHPGATYEGIEEEDLTLGMVLAARDMLRILGHQVLLTRDEDETLSLTDRLKMIDQYRAEAFVSVHCNAAIDNPETPQNEQFVINGLETYYRDDRDFPLANCIHKGLSAFSGRKVIGLFQDVARLNKRLTVLNNDAVPSCLVEVGYISHPGDRDYIARNIKTLGEIIAHGMDWFAHLKAGTRKQSWPG